MKKNVLFVLIVFCILIQIRQPIHANTDSLTPLVVEKGMGNDELLDTEYAELTYNPVDWNQPGTYSVTYFDPRKGELKNRTVLIVEKDQLETGLVHSESIEYQSSDITSVTDVCYLNANQLVLVGTKRIEGDSLQMVLPQAVAWMQFYENDILLFEKVWEDFSSIFAVKPSVNGILIGLTLEEELLYPDIILLEIACNGNILRQKRIQGNGIEVGSDLFFRDNHLYLFYTSDSSVGDASFDFMPAQYTVLMKCRYDNFEIQNVKTYGNNQLNNWVGVEWQANRFAVLQEFTGTAGVYRHKNGNYHVQYFMLIDSELNTLYQEPMTHFYSNLYIEAERAFLVRCKTIAEEYRIECYGYSLVDLTHQTQEYSFSSTAVTQVKVVKTKEGKTMLCLLAGSPSFNQEQTTGFLFVNNQDNSLFYPYEKTMNKATLYSFSASNQLVSWQVKDEKIIKNHFVLLRMKVQSASLIQGQLITTYQLCLNGTDFTQVNHQNTIIEQFGWHENRLVTRTDYVEVHLKNKFYVKKEISIRNQADYDQQVTLRFNGEGYLNDQVITSPYLVDMLGSYCLIVYGSEGEREVINFTVSELCTKQDDQALMPSPINSVLIDSALPAYTVTSEIVFNPLDKDKTIHSFLFFGMGASLSVAVWFILMRKRGIR